MTSLLLLAALQVVVPAALLAWLWFGRPKSRVEWLARCALAAGTVLLVLVAGVWRFPPIWTGYVLAGILPIAMVRAWGRTAGAEYVGRLQLWLGRATLAAAAACAAVTWFYAIDALQGWPPPRTEALALDFPLRDGTYYVANGGSRGLINAHIMTLQPQYAAFRGQSYGTDIMQLDWLGRRGTGVLPADPAAYFIFGASVHAPCSGTVHAAEDGFPDQAVPIVDREHMAGNHVILRCGDYEILLGHLMRGSVAVQAGAFVRSGEVLGRVGNSGNSDEPHLHVHVQKPAAGDQPFAAEPVAATFSGKYLVRNRLVRA